MLQPLNAIRQLLIALAIATALVRADETHSVITTLGSTTITGYVDTSGYWWPGSPGPLPGQLPNDNIANAAPLAGPASQTQFSLAGASYEAGEPLPTGAPRGGTIWYKWTPETSGRMRFSLSEIVESLAQPQVLRTTAAASDESIFFPWGGVNWGFFGVVMTTGNDSLVGHISFDGTNESPPPEPPLLIAFRQTAPNELVYIQQGGDLSFLVAANETIYLAMEASLNTIPSGTLFAKLTPPPVNDSFQAALPIENVSAGNLEGHFVAAGREAGEPELGAPYSGASVWFHWKAPIHGYASVQNHAAAIFKGETLATLTCVAKDPSNVSFLAEEGVEYFIALYGAAEESNYSVNFNSPLYRTLETTVATLFPGNLPPHLFGLRGSTALLYARTENGWRCVEIEPITNESADFRQTPQNAFNGELRVITIDETLPSPRVELRPTGNTFAPVLVGLPGQTCAVANSADLQTWSEPRVYTLQTRAVRLPILDAANPKFFYRVTQSFARPPGP